MLHVQRINLLPIIDFRISKQSIGYSEFKLMKMKRNRAPSGYRHERKASNHIEIPPYPPKKQKSAKNNQRLKDSNHFYHTNIQKSLCEAAGEKELS